MIESVLVTSGPTLAGLFYYPLGPRALVRPCWLLVSGKLSICSPTYTPEHIAQKWLKGGEISQLVSKESACFENCFRFSWLLGSKANLLD